MSTAFTWGFPEQGMGDVVPQDVTVVLQDELRKAQTTSFLTPQSASPTAQNATGLGIQNVKRGFLSLVIPFDGSIMGIDFQTSSTSFVDVSSELTGSLTTAGRPVMIIVRGTSTGDPCTFSVSIDKKEVTKVSAGITTSAKGDGIWFAQPAAGDHTYAMQWKVASGTAIMPRSYRPALTVVEI